jgi:predicted transcriptional regulator
VGRSVARGWEKALSLGRKDKEGDLGDRDGQIHIEYCGGRRTRTMGVHFTPDQEAKLSRMAEAQGLAAEALVQEAVKRFLNFDEWFTREVDKGLAAANRGEFVEHDAVRRMIESRYPA